MISCCTEYSRTTGGSASFAAGAQADAAFRLLDTAVIVPLRPHGEATAFVCLGTRLSHDVYTTTDLALLGSVAHAASTAIGHV